MFFFVFLFDFLNVAVTMDYVRTKHSDTYIKSIERKGEINSQPIFSFFLFSEKFLLFFFSFWRTTEKNKNEIFLHYKLYDKVLKLCFFFLVVFSNIYSFSVFSMESMTVTWYGGLTRSAKYT